MSWKRWKGTKKITKDIVKISVFILLVSLPFITITQTIGIDTFLDSFEHPEYYTYLQEEDILFGSKTNNDEYIIIQKSTHPDFNIETSDSIIYFKSNGDIVCNEVFQINSIGGIKRYYTTEENDITNRPIYDGQIIGKVISAVDDNIWNLISLKVWDTSIHNINLRALLTND